MLLLCRAEIEIASNFLNASGCVAFCSYAVYEDSSVADSAIENLFK